MINYPEKLDSIFHKLNKNGASPIIIGGFVRDSILKIESKDIDIEVYGIESFDSLESILSEFGNVNSVGKSFGVCKLTMDDLDLDFSLPREDSKISVGHKGFNIRIDSTLDFKTASSRRDFTINAIGYDVINKTILDPFNGIEDLKNKTLKVVDEIKFQEDPLRILRAVQFSARFNLKIDHQLLLLSQKMCKNGMLKELAKERVFDEIKKLLLKAKKPSIGLKLLKEINALVEFPHLHNLSMKDWDETLNSVDNMKLLNPIKNRTLLMLSVLCYKLDNQQIQDFIGYLTNEKNILKQVLILIKNINQIQNTDSQLYKLATILKIEELILLKKAIYKKDSINYKNTLTLEKKARQLNILTSPYKAILDGKDILELGIEPSKIYSDILNNAYEAQINYIFTNKSDAKEWLKNHIEKLNL